MVRADNALDGGWPTAAENFNEFTALHVSPAPNPVTTTALSTGA
jgi:hypothetical protein